VSRALILYHNDQDGACAALVRMLSLPEGSDPELKAVQYGQEPPDVAGREVYVLDFSYPRETMEAMAKTAKSLMVLDHHETAEAALDGLPFATFSEKRSGAGMAVDAFGGQLHGLSPEETARLTHLVNYVEDFDLWRFVRPWSKEINAWIQSFPLDVRQWPTLFLTHDWWRDSNTTREGGAIVRARDAGIAKTLGAAQEVFLGGQRCAGINGGGGGSYLLNALLVRAWFLPVACSWFQVADGQTVYSVCSRPGGPNVAELCSEFGGGGHANAAGFHVPEPVHKYVGPLTAPTGAK